MRTSAVGEGPQWLELITDDPLGSAEFYSWLFGWTIRHVGPTIELGDESGRSDRATPAVVVRKQGSDGLVGWVPFFAVDPRTYDRIHRDNVAGTPKRDSSQLITDPEGVWVGITRGPRWQPLAWPEVYCEHPSRDVEHTAGFYAELLGSVPMAVEDDPFDYQYLIRSDLVLGGIIDANLFLGVGHPYWMAYFAAESTETTAARAVEAGALIRVIDPEPPVGPYAVLEDPSGAVFGISQFPNTRVAELERGVDLRDPDGRRRTLSEFRTHNSVSLPASARG